MEHNNPILFGKEVLVVDDDPMILRSMNLMLTQAGLVPTLVADGQQALAILENRLPDIIILDYMMPGMTGAEVFDLMRIDDRYAAARTVPVIMLTAKTDNYEEQRSLFKKGLSAYLFKPFGQRELFNVLGNIVVLETTRRENERLMLENLSMRNFLQGVFDGITDIVSIQNDAFEVIRHNRAADHVTGAQKDNSCFRRYFGRQEVCPNCPALNTLKGQQASSADIEFNDSIYEVRTYPVVTAGERAFVEIIKDVTQQRRLDKKLAESSKLATVGTLAAGVAHEINNPLSIILGSAQAMLTEETFSPEGRRDVETIEAEANRCGRIVRDLLEYARPSASEPRPCNLNEIAQHAVGLVRHLIKKKGVDLRENYAQDLRIVADPHKIQQVLINLLMNAVQTTQEGGRISIESRQDGGFADVLVADSGSGIAEADLPRVFEPFFSRKPGGGIGLGLAVSKAIVEEHGGMISVRSLFGSGTTVTVRFRMAELHTV